MVKLLTPNASSLAGLPAGSTLFQAQVDSSDSKKTYNVSLLVTPNAQPIVEAYCSCPNFWLNAFNRKWCKHVISALETAHAATKTLAQVVSNG